MAHQHPPGSAAHFPERHIAHDFTDAQTGLRGLVLRGPLSWCGYVGAPTDHVLNGLEDLRFACHYGVNFAAMGDDDPLPAGHFWWGWDYAHAGDLAFFESTSDPEMDRLLDRAMGGGRPRKDWTADEVRQHVAAALQELRGAIADSASLAASLLRQPTSPG